MAIKQCLCVTEKGPCHCRPAQVSQIPVQFPTAAETATSGSGATFDASKESLRCICPEEGHDGRQVGKPCACNSAVEPGRPPEVSAVARDLQEEQNNDILPVIPTTPLPPVETSPLPNRPNIHCLCLIHELDGGVRPCACNQAIYHLGFVDYLNQN